MGGDVRVVVVVVVVVDGRKGGREARGVWGGG